MTGGPPLHGTATDVAQRLLAYCRANDWAGYDPYDALNGTLIASSPLMHSRFTRLALTQALKRSPINVRPLLGVPATQSAKALALVVSALSKAPEIGGDLTETIVTSVAEKLVALRSRESSHDCWGYNFPWQTRHVLVPSGSPNLVCTTTVAAAFLDLYERNHDARYLATAVSAADYLLSDLYWTDGDGIAGFSYPVPAKRPDIHNANLLGSALLCRVYAHTGESRFVEPALAAARHAVSRQRADGSWAYGEAATQQWIDNFHTGYNLCALRSIARDTGAGEFDPVLARGFQFYREHFFCDDGAVRYFHDRPYPVDIHCVAQSILTLLTFKELHPDNTRLARAVFRWTVEHMWDERGFFYYQVQRFWTVRTSYMRWSQAWMLLALSWLIRECEP